LLPALSMATIVNIDRASQALSKDVPPDVPRIWAARWKEAMSLSLRSIIAHTDVIQRDLNVGR
jgi:hypothetical protein